MIATPTNKPTVASMRFMPDLIEPMKQGTKTETRRAITKGNSILDRGAWEDLRWETGNVTDPDYRVLRVRCPINGHMRTVQVTPKRRLGDLLWVREGQKGKRATRKGSALTLSVMTVRASRLQQIQDHEAMAEGVGELGVGELGHFFDPDLGWDCSTNYTRAHDSLVMQMRIRQRDAYLSSPRFKELEALGTVPPRAAFAVLWDLINGPGAWDSNPLVWVYRFDAIALNIEKVLKTGV